jgi:DNA-binding transcriptional MerR regulator
VNKMKHERATRHRVLKRHSSVGKPAPDGGITIGELARSVGVPDSTVRYYEKQGLLRPSGRTSGNYRQYAPEAIDRLRFIRAAQASGFALKDIAALVDFQDGIAPCEDVRLIISERLKDVSRQMQELRHVGEVLEAFSRACARTPRGKDCPVLVELSHPKQ